MMRQGVKGALLLCVTLVAGILIGMSVERRRAPSHDPAAGDIHHMMRRFDSDLDLDSAQHATIAAILARRQSTVDSTWRLVQPHMHAMIDSTLREILGVLRPDQAAKYRQMVEAHHPGSLER